MKLKPLGDRVVVKPVEQETKTKSGLIIPDTAKEATNIGEVIAVGPGKEENGKLKAMSVKVGDKIAYDAYGREFKFDEKKVVILKEEEILGVIE